MGRAAFTKLARRTGLKQVKTLYLMRHAKSSWKDAMLSDRQRPLNKRGQRDAPEMGRRLRDKGIVLDRILSSPARRALNTAQLVAQAVDYPIEGIDQSETLYFSSTSTMLALIQQLDERWSTVLLVSHNPDISALLQRLCHSDIDDMTTAAIATLQFDWQWRDIRDGSGRLSDYDFPKNR